MTPGSGMNTCSPSSRLLASGQSAKNAADHLGARAGSAGLFIVESAEPDTYSRRLAPPRFGLDRHPVRALPSLGVSSLTAGASAPAFFRSSITRRATSPMLPQVSLVAPSRCSSICSPMVRHPMIHRSTIHVGKIRKVVGV